MADNAEKKKKSDLGPRLVTAAVAIPILLYLIFAAPTWAFGVLALWAATTATWEYANITIGSDVKAAPWFAAAVSGALYVVFYWFETYFLAATCLSLLVIFLYFLFNHEDGKEVSRHIASTATAVFYGTILVGTMALLHRDTGNAGPFWILILLALVWIGDTGAYFAGRAFGKNKLYESVSPNKTIEGAVGGFLASVACAFGLNALFPVVSGSYEVLGIFDVNVGWTSLSWWQVLLVVVPANILGQAGDLAESLIKRAHDVKDSGTIIYGHGGMLDRIDALIFAAPWVYICVRNLL